jgi:hypothetical protein
MGAKKVNSKAKKHFDRADEYVKRSQKARQKGDKAATEKLWDKADENVRKGLEALGGD